MQHHSQDLADSKPGISEIQIIAVAVEHKGNSSLAGQNWPPPAHQGYVCLAEVGEQAMFAPTWKEPVRTESIVPDPVGQMIGIQMAVFPPRVVLLIWRGLIEEERRIVSQPSKEKGDVVPVV